MTEIIKKITKNRIIVASIFFIAGLLCIIFPIQVIKSVSLVFGIVLFLFGVFQLATILDVKNSRFIGFSAIAATFGILIGLVLILNQESGTLVVGLWCGIWALVVAFIHIFQAWILYLLGMSYTDSIVKAVCEFLFAILLFINMTNMLTVQIILMGVVLIIYAIYTLVRYFYLLKMAKEVQDAGQELIENVLSAVDDDKHTENVDSQDIIIEGKEIGSQKIDEE